MFGTCSLIKLGLTFEFHADFQALLKPTEWTPFPLRFVYVTTSFRHARVNFLVLNGSFEKSLTGFAREEAVVVAGDLVAANWAELLDAVLRVRQVSGGQRRRRSGNLVAGAHVDPGDRVGSWGKYIRRV